MAGKERSIEIVDAVGNTVLTLSGDTPGGMTAAGNRRIHDLEEFSRELVATAVDNYVWTCREGVWQLAYASSVIAVTGGASAAVQLMVCNSTQLPAAGIAQLTAALDLQETAPNTQLGTLIASPTLIFPTMHLATDFSGTLTGLVGNLTFVMKRVS